MCVLSSEHLFSSVTVFRPCIAIFRRIHTQAQSPTIFSSLNTYRSVTTNRRQHEMLSQDWCFPCYCLFLKAADFTQATAFSAWCMSVEFQKSRCLSIFGSLCISNADADSHLRVPHPPRLVCKMTYNQLCQIWRAAVTRMSFLISRCFPLFRPAQSKHSHFQLAPLVQSEIPEQVQPRWH